MNLAKGYLSSFQGGGEVAALTAEDAIDAVSPRTGGNIPMGADPIMQQNMTQPSLSDEVAAYQQTPEYRQPFPGMNAQQSQNMTIENQPQFDAGRFGGSDLADARHWAAGRSAARLRLPTRAIWGRVSRQSPARRAVCRSSFRARSNSPTYRMA